MDKKDFLNNVFKTTKVGFNVSKIGFNVSRRVIAGILHPAKINIIKKTYVENTNVNLINEKLDKILNSLEKE